MAQLKTRPTGRSVARFLAGITDEERRRECRAVVRLMRDVTGKPAKMWGPSIVGFGSFRYRYDSGRAGDWLQTGFSPRKGALTLYVMPGVRRYPDLLARLGKFTTGVSCLYVKRLADIDQSVLKTLIRRSMKDLATLFPRT